MPPTSPDQSRRCLCDLRVRQCPLADDTYLLRLPFALLLRAARRFFRLRAVVREDDVRPKLLEISKLFRARFFGRPRLLAIGPRISENISHPTPAAMRREAMGLWRACFAKMGRTSSPRLRAFTPPNKSLTTVVGET